MRYSRNIWQQLKNLTADDLIGSLERDGWKRDESDGADIVATNTAPTEVTFITANAQNAKADRRALSLWKPNWTISNFCIGSFLTAWPAPQITRSSPNPSIGLTSAPTPAN
jgi:hypothetical protein